MDALARSPLYRPVAPLQLSPEVKAVERKTMILKKDFKGIEGIRRGPTPADKVNLKLVSQSRNVLWNHAPLLLWVQDPVEQTQEKDLVESGLTINNSCDFKDCFFKDSLGNTSLGILDLLFPHQMTRG